MGWISGDRMGHFMNLSFTLRRERFGADLQFQRIIPIVWIMHWTDAMVGAEKSAGKLWQKSR